MTAPPFPITIARLSGIEHASVFMNLRLLALQTDPDAYLATFESESSKTELDFARELDYARGLGYLGYYGAWVQTATDRILVGYCQIAQSFLAKQKHVLFIHNLYLHKDYRHKGIAKALIEYITDRAVIQGIEIIFLSCNERNQQAFEFYKKCGFKECGRKPRSLKWQGVYDDEIEMVKSVI